MSTRNRHLLSLLPSRTLYDCHSCERSLQELSRSRRSTVLLVNTWKINTIISYRCGKFSVTAGMYNKCCSMSLRSWVSGPCARAHILKVLVHTHSQYHSATYKPVLPKHLTRLARDQQNSAAIRLIWVWRVFGPTKLYNLDTLSLSS